MFAFAVLPLRILVHFEFHLVFCGFSTAVSIKEVMGGFGGLIVESMDCGLIVKSH